MSDLIQSVSYGSVTQTATDTTTSTSSLDKDAFLQLLVTQMKYQDPLNPNTDTQFVEQLATFSQLEQMQNLNQTTSNNQAFGLVGMDVVVSTTNSAGNAIYQSGTVDYVVMSNGVAKLAIGDSLYTLSQLEQVYDGTYLLKKGLPYITNEVSETFDKEDPKDITFEVNVGSGETIATDVAVIIGDSALDSQYISLDGNKVTISKEAFMDLENGTYKPVLMFNDALYTTVANKITVTVTGTVEEDETISDDDEIGEDTD